MNKRRGLLFCLTIAVVISLCAASAWAIEPYQFIAKWGSYGSGDGEFIGPGGLAVDASDNVYAVDYNNYRIEKFSSTGAFITKWGSYGSGDGQFIAPTGLAVDASGNVYVTDDFLSSIQKFSSAGGFISKWIATGDQPYNPYGIAVDSFGNIYVSDNSYSCVQKFSSTGAFIKKWGSYGSGDGQFSNPNGIAVDAAGNIYVADSDNNSVQKFSSTGTFITKWGSYGSADGQFNGSYGVAVDASDNVYVTDFYNHRVQKFSSSGAFITKWGTYGSGDGQFSSPTGIAVDASGNVYVSDAGNNRIQKFVRSTLPLPLSVQPACPASVKVAEPLTVTVDLYNRSCDYSVSVSRFTARVIGNADGTLSGLGIFGPYNRQLNTPRVVPPATCSTTTTPGTETPFNLMVMNEVPASLSGKMATVDIEAITDKGQTFGGGKCMVKVVP